MITANTASAIQICPISRTVYLLPQPLHEVVAYLTEQSGIADLTPDLAEAQNVTTRPIAQGGLADVYRATLPTGRYAVKCLRQRSNKEIKVSVDHA
jgi:predicted unusual protein kinase regulating ubiquinone biosynthesis (AarF/ABC1/UbiB family)